MPPDDVLERLHPAPVAGIDEAGRGPWAGPVVAAAVLFDPRLMTLSVDDSKRLTAARREKLFDAICAVTAVGVGIVEVEDIDRINILQASLIAMRRAVEALPRVPASALVDGCHAPPLPCPAVPIVRGDSKSVSVAAASVIAKVTRDRLMRRLHRDHPHYGWDRNAGYGTAIHRAALLRHGVSPHHRRSFAPVKTLLS